MRDNIIILHGERVEYTVKDTNGDPTGEIRKFCRIQYISDEPQDDSRYKGFTVSQGQGPVELWDQLDLLPGIYEVRFRKTTVMDRYGRAKVGLEPETADLVGDPGLVFDSSASTAKAAS